MQSRRTVLGHIVAGGAAATIAAPAIAGPDPVFGLIEAYREAEALHSAALKEQERLEIADDPRASEVADEPCHAEFRAWRQLVSTAPKTLTGVGILPRRDRGRARVDV